jgi:ribosomal protein L37AE/L43A
MMLREELMGKLQIKERKETRYGNCECCGENTRVEKTDFGFMVCDRCKSVIGSGISHEGRAV